MAETTGMRAFLRVVPAAFAIATLVPIALAVGGGACDGSGTFDGGVGPDAGFGEGEGIDPADIGKPCTYNPADPGHPNPANQCAPGLDCLIVTSDAAETGYDFGLGLPAW